jgi:tetratricopeptide (TPR) repeat protein
MEDFNAAVLINDKYLLALNNLGNAKCKLENLTSAMEDYNKVITLDPSFGLAYLNRGYVKEQLGDLEGACADWKQADALGVKNAGLYLKECK